MKFNKLRVVGFKSFVEPSEFIIEPGLTGIVGPNGCGKSNLVEALRWVMGESSYKNMRASGMDDVIFSGSGNRPARNSAEVGLYLDNSDRTAPAAFNDSDEIQVTRRIEREQGSVYRINGKEARARDVQLLFADASTGARSPSMVGQGRIGELIQAKPQARRQLLEEAAGISGLHSRRHEAELRLRAAEGNLERLEDVTNALDGQIESLKRQARQANRFKMLSADIRSREARLLHIRWVQAKESEGEAESALNQATMVVAERAQEQMEAAKNQAIASLKLPELREEEARRAAALQRLQIARNQLDEDAARILRRRDELTRRLAQLDDDIRREQELVADNAGILESLDAEEAELGELLADAGQSAEETRLAMEAAAGALAASEAAFSRITAERAEAAAARAQLEKLLRETGERRLRLDRQMSDASREAEAVEREIGDLADLERIRLDVEAVEIAIGESEATIEAMDADIAAARNAERDAREAVNQARTALNRLETEATTIIRMLEASGVGDGYAPISEAISVDRGFETALGAVLGDALDASLDHAAPAFWAGSGVRPDDPELPAGCERLSAHVKAPPALSRRLAQIGVVDELDGERLMGELKPGQRLVSRDGAVWRWDGHVTRADVPSHAALRMQQKNRLAGIENEILEAGDANDQVALRHRECVEAINRLEADLQGRKDEGRMLARRLADARNELAKAERAVGEALRRRAVIEELRSGLEIQIAELEITEEDARIALADAPDPASLDLALREQSAGVATDRAVLAEARAIHDGQARENEARRRRIAAIGAERNTWKNRADGARRQIEALETRRAETGDELEMLLEAPGEFEEKRFQLLSEITRAEKERRDAADRLASAETVQREADQIAANALATLAESREKRGRAEERVMAARQWREEAEARIREKLSVAPHDVLRLAGLGPDEPLGDPKALEIEIERLKIERERLGAVNLRAEEEQKELSDKLNQLVAEREDVIEAIRKLRLAIQSLNREGRERLLAAFDAVNIHFKRLFTHLFNGGEAELQLIESDDPLEAGLEILARPPGKKPQTMTLLSGGEQALTAMALIFAVFLTNPAPICVLDEVDAPLDDHNVERYCNLMDEMSKLTQTRFVIITHNPITMARMNRLFGVTMAEQGVSQLVSVDLQTAEQLREAV